MHASVSKWMRNDEVPNPSEARWTTRADQKSAREKNHSHKFTIEYRINARVGTQVVNEGRL